MKIPASITSAAQAGTDLLPLRIAGVPEHFNLPWMLALERRAFVRAGVELKWHTVPEGTGRMCTMLRNSELDLAILVTEGAVRDILRGGPYRIIGHYVDTPLTWGVHVGAASPIATPADIKDVPYAISRLNSGSHLAAVAYAQAHGCTPKDTDLVVVNDMAGAVERLRTTERMAFLWEKFTTKPAVDAGLLRRVDEHRSPWPAFVVVATEAALAEHPREVERVLKVVRDQARGLMEKKTAPEMVAQRYKMDLEDARQWFGGVRWSIGGAPDTTMLEGVVKALAEAGMLSDVNVVDGVVDHLLWTSGRA
ncbi:MAG: ABC transporter substrate-binding protein [Flavobacteriales bacterium]|nr:ABC transporter substrate-binding protein [Flavobacteriales bacterium]